MTRRLFAIGSTFLACLLAPLPSLACPWCRPEVEAGIYGPGFWTNVGFALLPFVVIAPIIYAVERLHTPSPRPASPESTAPRE